MSVWRAMARGFTLIEMAIVMVVLGLVVSGGIVAARPIIENSKTSETRAKLDRIESALLLHAIRYGCLPCPATGTGTGGTGGIARNNTPTDYTTGCATACEVTTRGVVPWQNLDLSENDIIDGFGTRISYAASSAIVVTNGMNRSGSNYDPAGTLEVQNNAASSPATLTSAAAYVLISHGPNRAFGYTGGTGVLIDPPGNTSVPEGRNNTGPPFSQGDRIDAAGTTQFDDIVRWRTKPIITQLCGDGSCGNPS